MSSSKLVKSMLCALCIAVSGCERDIPTVFARAETAPVPTANDAADDAAIWLHPDRSDTALIVATDKGSGLLVYDLNGEQRQYLPLGRLNNVDLRQAPWQQPRATLVATTRRQDPAGLVLLSLDPDTGSLAVRAEHVIELANPYGICLYRAPAGQPYVIVNGKDGKFLQYAVDEQFGITLSRTWRTASQPEGCVVDDRTATLYLGEESRGIWQMSARPEDSVEMRLLDEVANGLLHSDVEGLALHQGADTHLIASSQGNDSFIVYDVATEMPVGSFRVSASDSIDGVSETDGVSATVASLPGYAGGLVIVHDDRNESPQANQNFKLIAWEDIEQVLTPCHEPNC